MDVQLITTLAIVSTILLLALLFLLIRRTKIARIASFSWQRTVKLEHYIWVEESSYAGYPEGSRNQHSTLEAYNPNAIDTAKPYSTTNKILQIVGSDDNGTNPHLRIKYIYEIQQWCRSRDVIAKGDDCNPYWPQYDLDPLTSERVHDTK